MPTIRRMVPVLRILDPDEGSLSKRLEAALAQFGDEQIVVDRFTHWYTTRPPLHEAVLLRAAA